MSSKNEVQKLKRGLLRAENKSAKQAEAQQKFLESMMKKRRRIEVLFEISVTNQIYIFPKTQVDEDFSQTDSEGLDDKEENLTYHLIGQNKRDKNYQTLSSIQQRDNMLQNLLTQNLILKKKMGTQSQQSFKENYDSKNETNTSNYQTRSRKQKQQQKTSANSSKKLLFVPQVRENTKKPSQTIIVSFRGKHGDRPSSRANKSELR